MLERLSGRVHHVLTGFCIVARQGQVYQEEVTTAVRFKNLLPEEIMNYLETNEWQDKAGAYAVQSQAAFMVKEITGSYTNVVGLPLCQVVEALQRITSDRSLDERQ